ncbi:hypothetical protein GCM10020220_102060 [Nonomuraea rubra]
MDWMKNFLAGWKEGKKEKPYEDSIHGWKDGVPDGTKLRANGGMSRTLAAAPTAGGVARLIALRWQLFRGCVASWGDPAPGRQTVERGPSDQPVRCLARPDPLKKVKQGDQELDHQ